MGVLDWIVFLGFLVYTIWDGARSGKDSKTLGDYFLANRTMPWWAMGLSIMATQASAITFISTTGLAFNENMRFIQVYLAVPFAMAILSVTLVPFFYKKRSFTAYEVLEERFGLPTRLVTALLFLVSRGLALGTVIAAPAYVMALVLGQPLWIMVIAIGLTATIYTMFGGVSGVIKTDVKQMAAILIGLVVCFTLLVSAVSDHVKPAAALELAGKIGKLETVDFSFNPSERYNVWSGILAGIFLMVSYFGCDQTQVQRYLTARSLPDARRSLYLNAFAKVPMQFLVLLIGVWMYLFYVFQPSPLTFRTYNPAEVSGLEASARFTPAFDSLHTVRRTAAVQWTQSQSDADLIEFKSADSKIAALRAASQAKASEAAGTNLDDTNYIFPYFIVSEMPAGIAGLIIAAIFAAALSSIDSTLSSLSSVTVMDWYHKLTKGSKPENHYLKASKWSTLAWGITATGAAWALGETSSIVELVNQIGSYFYGSLLGIFVLMLAVPKAGGKAALTGLFAGMLMVFFCDTLYSSSDGVVFSSLFTAPGSAHSKTLAYLWLNPIGTVTVVVTGWMSSFVTARPNVS